MSETWFDSQNGKFTAKIKAAGFHIIHANRDEKRGGGVAILYGKSLKIKPGEGSTTRFTSFEFKYCCFQTGGSKIILICLYRLQEVDCNIFCQELEGFIESIFHKEEIMIVVGDICCSTSGWRIRKIQTQRR